MKIILIVTVIMGMALSQSIAQNAKNIVPQENSNMYPEFIEFDASNAPTFKRGKVALVNEKGSVSGNAEVKEIHFDKDELGFTHYRNQQLYNGIPVEHAQYIVHEKDGLIRSQNGKMVRNFPAQLNTKPLILEADALRRALQFVGAKTYMWENAGEENLLKSIRTDNKATYFPKGELVLYGGHKEVIPESLKLSYKFEIFAQFPLSKQWVYVDAQTGDILGNLHRIYHVDKIGKATTVYSGVRNITTDSVGKTTFRLRETGRGNGIQTLNMKNAGKDYSAAVDFKDADNNWNNVNASMDQYATDAHWGAEKTYDYYKTTFNRNSIDNAGKMLLNYVHANLANFGLFNNANAFWDGERMTYGDGDNNYTPMTSLETIGHEITHGVTQFSSNLNYAGESGALNEAISDIFAIAINFSVKPGKANWAIGDEEGPAFRSLSNPNAFNQPDTYGGVHYLSLSRCTPDANNDYCGVHTNSGVVNFWFYLLVNGGTGTNDNGTAYNVTGIGITKAAAIVYNMNNNYLVSTSKFSDAYIYSIKAAKALYGEASAAAVQVANAWAAVGVTSSSSFPPCLTHYEPNETIATAKGISVNNDVFAGIHNFEDKDYFKVTTTASEPKLKITLTNLPVDYDIKLFNSAGTLLGTSENGRLVNETIMYNDSAVASTYYVSVYCYTINVYNNYTADQRDKCYTLRASTSSTNFTTANATIGAPTVRPVITVSNSKMVTVFPNPLLASHTLNIMVNARESTLKQINITDLYGRNVFTKNVTIVAGVNNISLQNTGLLSGTYLVRVGENYVSKLIVQ